MGDERPCVLNALLVEALLERDEGGGLRVGERRCAARGAGEEAFLRRGRVEALHDGCGAPAHPPRVPADDVEACPHLVGESADRRGEVLGARVAGAARVPEQGAGLAAGSFGRVADQGQPEGTGADGVVVDGHLGRGAVERGGGSAARGRRRAFPPGRHGDRDADRGQGRTRGRGADGSAAGWCGGRRCTCGEAGEEGDGGTAQQGPALDPHAGAFRRTASDLP